MSMRECGHLLLNKWYVGRWTFRFDLRIPWPYLCDCQWTLKAALPCAQAELDHSAQSSAADNSLTCLLGLAQGLVLVIMLWKIPERKKELETKLTQQSQALISDPFLPLMVCAAIRFRREELATVSPRFSASSSMSSRHFWWVCAE